jgi:hypothetical protein
MLLLWLAKIFLLLCKNIVLYIIIEKGTNMPSLIFSNLFENLSNMFENLEKFHFNLHALGTCMVNFEKWVKDVPLPLTCKKGK